MPLVASSELRRWSLVILRTTPEIFVLAGFLLLLLLIYGIIGIHLFSGTNNCYAAAMDDDTVPRYIKRSFSNIGQALIALYDSRCGEACGRE